MFRSAWFRALVILSSIIVLGAVVLTSVKKPPPETSPDECISCHGNITNVGKSHPISAFGCYKCHGGNPYATNKKVAHEDMVSNPALLNLSNSSCEKCHPHVAERVKNSIMNTMEGIINETNYQLGGTKNPFGTITVSELEEQKNKRSFAIQYFRKMCGACHIDQPQSIFPKTARRGGGCVDCHAVFSKKNHHIVLTTRIPSSNCVKCHNRSNRIGLSYFGRFESPGYGTPYENGHFSHRILGGSRYWYPLTPDVHEKAGMGCIDCHTSVGVMGNGQRKLRMWYQEDIECIDCHKPQLGQANPLAEKLAFYNGKVPTPHIIAYTHRFHTPLYNVQEKGKKIILYLKKSGKPITVPTLNSKPYHTLKFHKKLSCQACHSKWMPECYGCHVAEFQTAKQFDWVSHRITAPAFREFSSFYRHSIQLGVSYNGKITPFGPGCQTFVTQYSGKRNIHQFHSVAFAPWDPHTTQLKARSCANCHINPVTLGLGRGTLFISHGNIEFYPIFKSKTSGLPISYPLDATESITGKPYVKTSMPGEHPFTGKELRRIIGAWKCIICHDKYSDPIYRNFKQSLKMFREGVTKCLRK